jgi:hypothetical protein
VCTAVSIGLLYSDTYNPMLNMKWLINKIKSYSQTRTRLREQRKIIRREIELVKIMGMADPPTHVQVVEMYNLVSTKGCVIFKNITSSAE